MYKIPTLLSIGEVAGLAGLAESSVRTYRTRGQVPPPDAMIGSTPGWMVSTIQPWAEALPGQGARIDRRQPPPGQHPDPVTVARRILALIRSAVDISALTAPEPRSPHRVPVRQAGWTAAGHLARTTAAYETLPWLELAEDLGGDLGDPDDAGQAEALLRVVDEHLARARARLAERRPQPDWQDHIAVAAELEHIARRAADLRMVSALEATTTPEEQ